jgi:CBS domain-containing protein/gamma-glutamyl:cysteine ligase YbdK (ATP-grasp superfamily)
MGTQEVDTQTDGIERRQFVRHVLNDLRALEMMLADGWIEADVRRIGAEQEMFLVDRNWRPATAALQLLEQIDDPHFTTELGQFNLELNLDPQEFGGDCLNLMEAQLGALLDKLRQTAHEHGVDFVLTGILPTLRHSDLNLQNMTPKPRYHALNRAMCAMRDGAYELHIKGLDELLLRHDSVMLEACNASFQTHLQVGGEEFPNVYNVAQIVAGPVLAASVNSPLLFGRQLWRETRIALFQQSVDTRSSMNFLRERSPRVTFGKSWVRESVLELFQEDLARFRSLVTSPIDEDPVEEVLQGRTPKLAALCLHNSTVYRWNRACYGTTDGKPHLRIENRVFPSGPTVTDEIANAALWFGLVNVLSKRFDDITRLIHFEDARMNFRSAARLGLGAEYVWFNGVTLPGVKLICDRLLPLAHEGLIERGVRAEDADRYLGVIERRVTRGRTGAQWITMSLAGMRNRRSMAERLSALTAAMVQRQTDGRPVGEWEPAQLSEGGDWKQSFLKVEQFMTTDLFTVNQDDSLDLVASVMEWKRIRHVPVEDHGHRLVGLISYRALLKLLARGVLAQQQKQIAVSEVMTHAPITVAPDASTLEAIELMRQNGISCLPVVKEQRLVGVITERDLMNVAAELLEERLKQ